MDFDQNQFYTSSFMSEEDFVLQISVPVGDEDRLNKLRRDVSTMFKSDSSYQFPG